MIINMVYHWSPRKNRDAILKDGIKILMSELEYENPVTGKPEVWNPPYICTSPDPETALVYVEPTFDGEVPALDLYQVWILETDKVVFRNDGTNRIIEVRVKNTIPPDRIRYIATRD
jgi:hypothetical protein